MPAPDFTAVAGTGTGDFRMFFMDSRNGVDAWNTYFRRSHRRRCDVVGRGQHLRRDVRAGYVTPTGFQEPYGDYGEIRITPAGKTYRDLGRRTELHRPGRCLAQPHHLIGGGRIGATAKPVGVPILAAPMPRKWPRNRENTALTGSDSGAYLSDRQIN